jgi:hypothetical protein
MLNHNTPFVRGQNYEEFDHENQQNSGRIQKALLDGVA